MDFEKLKNFRNFGNAFAKTMNLTVTDIQLGYAEAAMPVTEHSMNPIGSVHGGCLYTIADVAGGAAACSHGYLVTTLDADFHYLRPGIGSTRLTAVAREIKAGKRVLVYDISVMDQDGTVLAQGIFSYMSLGKEVPL